MTKAQRLARALFAEMDDEDIPVIKITMDTLERIAEGEPAHQTDDEIIEGILERVAIELGIEGESGEYPI